jgi:hypothetical protein
VCPIRRSLYNRLTKESKRMLTNITKMEVGNDYKITFRFSDQAVKTIDFSKYIGKNKLTSALADKKYFNQVKLYENGRGIYWPNGYDFCPDFLREIK